MLLRIGGFAGITGGILWFVGMATTSAGFGPRPLWFACLILGTLGILVALAGLSAFQAHRQPRLAWAAFAIPGLGTILSTFGLAFSILQPGDGPIVAGWSSWGIWALGLFTTVVGSLLFAVATVRAAVLSTRAATALAISAVVILFFAFGLGGEGSAQFETALLAAMLGSFAGSWAWLGASALRRGPIRAVVTA